METYIGVKLIEAEPMARHDFLTLVKGDTFNPKETDQEGYKVVYPDGYVSWSPKDVFEEAYRPTTGMNFGLAVEALKKGYKMARKGWNGKGIFIMLQVPDEHSKMTHPYIYIDTTGLQTNNPDAPKDRVPWIASQTDTLAEDWHIVEEV